MWSNLMATQRILDDRIFKEKGRTQEDTKMERILALRTELGEFANETRCFKFWSNKAPAAKDKRLEEWVDGLHFYLSLAILLELNPEDLVNHHQPIYYRNKERMMTDQINRAFDWITSEMTGEELRISLGHFINAAKLDGFELKDIETMYYIKNKINHERQDQGY
jgi:dimeric dUTPase (all-alpha-NTP-PPase superfamily)